MAKLSKAKCALAMLRMAIRPLPLDLADRAVSMS